MPDPSVDGPPTSRRSLLESATGRNALLLVGSSIMLLAGTAAIIYASGSYSGDSALWFVGFILISLSGLSMTAAIFTALGYAGNASEAFGLPSGSIRAILAIAIMVLLLIFGLPLITWDKAPRALDRTAFEAVRVDCAAAAAEVTRYQVLHVLAVLDTAACGTPPAPGQKAIIHLHGNVRMTMPVEQREQAKQVITAIVTLLTTIIGFYFGSQNALSLVNAIRGGEGDGDRQNSPKGQPGSDTRPEAAADDDDDADDGASTPRP